MYVLMDIGSMNSYTKNPRRVILEMKICLRGGVHSLINNLPFQTKKEIEMNFYQTSVISKFLENNIGLFINYYIHLYE